MAIKRDQPDLHFIFRRQYKRMKPFEDNKELYNKLNNYFPTDEIIENAQDTTTLLERYIDELEVDIDKNRLKSTMRTLYLEANDLEL